MPKGTRASKKPKTVTIKHNPAEDPIYTEEPIPTTKQTLTADPSQVQSLVKYMSMFIPKNLSDPTMKACSEKEN